VFGIYQMINAYKGTFWKFVVINQQFMYAIIGVTGHVGGRVAANLREAGLPFKAVVRNESRATALERKGWQTAVAELHDADALTKAFSNTKGVFVMTPPLLASADPVAEHDSMLKALTMAINAAKPGKLVYLSSVGAQHPLDTGAIRKLYEMEQAFNKLSLPTASIRASWFMENFVGQLGAVASGSPLMSFVDPPSKKIPMIAAADIGKLGAQLLQQNWIGHRVVELEGPCRYSVADVAMVFGYHLHKEVPVGLIAEAAYESAYRSFGFSDKGAKLMADMNRGFNSDHIVFERGSREQVQGETLLEDCLAKYIRN
jgi:NAD(P)H dehydrogenase (quinone)